MPASSIADKLPVVQFLFRKPTNFFSIEKVFDVLMPVLNNQVTCKRSSVPFISSSIGNVWRNIRAVRKLKGDLYHVTGDIHYIVFGLPRNKTILTIHDCVFLYHTKGVRKWLLHRLFLKWPAAYCKQITTISERTKMDIVKYSGCDPEKIVVIPNPVSAQMVYEPRPFRQQRPVLLFIGTTPNKNLERVIQAIAGIPCILDIVGPLSVEMDNELKKCSIQYLNSVSLSEEALVKKYIEADIILFPSLFEGFGLPIIEAQKAGRVVITSNLSPMKEVAANGACLVDPLNVESIRKGLLQVIQDDAYRKELIESGFLNVRQYEPAYIGDRYLQLYNSFLKEV